MMSSVPDGFEKLTPEQQKEAIHDVATYRQLQLQRQGQAKYGDSPYMPDLSLEEFLERLGQKEDGVTDGVSEFDLHPLLGQDGGAPNVPSVQNIDSDLAKLLNSSEAAELLILAYRKKHQLKFNPDMRKQLQNTYTKVFSPKPY